MSADEDESPDAEATPDVTSKAPEKRTPDSEEEARSEDDAPGAAASEASDADAPASDDDDAKNDDDAKDDDDEPASNDDDAKDDDDAPASDDDAKDDEAAKDDDAPASDDDAKDETAKDAPSKSDAAAADAAAAVDALAAAAKVKKPEDDYPLADERTLKRAGLGCIVLVILGSLFLFEFFHLAFRNITELDSDGVVEDSEPSRPPEPASPEAASSAEPTPGADESPAMPVDTRARNQITWMDDLEAATTAAQTQHRPLVVYFEARLTPDAQQVRDIAFGDRDVRTLAAGFVMADIDLATANDSARATAQHLGITGVPHMVVLRPDMTRLGEDVTTIDPPGVKRAMQAALRAFDQ